MQCYWQMRLNSDVPLCNYPPAVIIYSDLIQPLHCPKITRAADRLKKSFFSFMTLKITLKWWTYYFKYCTVSSHTSRSSCPFSSTSVFYFFKAKTNAYFLNVDGRISFLCNTFNNKAKIHICMHLHYHSSGFTSAHNTVARINVGDCKYVSAKTTDKLLNRSQTNHPKASVFDELGMRIKCSYKKDLECFFLLPLFFWLYSVFFFLFL